jgi:holo-[acyl-carrier protein] synthase
MSRLLQGIDLVEIQHLREFIQRHSARLEEIFSPAELEYALARTDPSVPLAGRFAAKEACLKALGLGLGMGEGLGALRAVEVLRLPSGRPQLSLSGWVERRSRQLGVCDINLTFSHTGHYAVASVVMLTKTGEELV